MIIVQKRYQYYSSNGIEWSKWFNYLGFDTKEEAEQFIKTVDKSTNKLKNEYQIQ